MKIDEEKLKTAVKVQYRPRHQIRFLILDVLTICLNITAVAVIMANSKNVWLALINTFVAGLIFGSLSNKIMENMFYKQISKDIEGEVNMFLHSTMGCFVNQVNNIQFLKTEIRQSLDIVNSMDTSMLSPSVKEDINKLRAVLDQAVMSIGV